MRPHQKNSAAASKVRMNHQTGAISAVCRQLRVSAIKSTRVDGKVWDMNAGRRSRRDDSTNTEKPLTEQHQSAATDKVRSLDVALPTTVIQPTRGWVPVNLKEVSQSRELLYFLVWGELKGRYKQAVLGVAWAIIQPLVMLAVYTIAFGIFVRVPTEGVPYAIFVYSALVPWTYFSISLSQSSNSLRQYEGLITKVYFPRLLVPLASVMAGLIDFVISFILLIGLLKFYGYEITLLVLTLPLFMLLAVTTALAVSLWLSALNVQYRDAGLLIPLLIQVWFFSTPIIYPSSLLPERWRPLPAIAR